MRESNELENIPEPARKHLNPRQSIDYYEHLCDLTDWLENKGKNPQKYEGYARGSAENYVCRLGQFYRWVWNEYDGYTTEVTHEQADAFVDRLADDEITSRNEEPYAESSKRKFVNAIEALFKWRAQTRGGETWKPSTTFSDGSYSPADEFTRDERRLLREVVLEYDTIPAYNDLSPEERDRWKSHLAQKLEKPKAEVLPADWERVNRSWKIPSLIYATLDAGLRPCEIKRSKRSWIRSQKGELHIPKEDSSKNRDNWKVTLRTKTVKILDRWLEQRANHTKYDDTESIWLTREGNPYDSASLNRLLDNLLDEAGIDQTHRDLVWYSFRHSLGTHMTDEGNLAQTNEQLRHKSLDTTLKYKNPSHDARRDTLDRIG